MTPERLSHENNHYKGTGIASHQDNSFTDASPKLKKRNRRIRAVGGAIVTLLTLQTGALWNRAYPVIDNKAAIIASAGIYYRNTAQQPVPRLDSPPPTTATTLQQTEVFPATKNPLVESSECNDGWEQLSKSICFMKLREFGSDIYVVRVDLKNPNVSVRPSFVAGPGRLGRLSEGAQRQGATAAINASFFKGTHALGPVADRGNWVQRDSFPQQVLIVNSDNTVRILPTQHALLQDPSQMKFALPGSHALVHNGIAVDDFGPDNAGGILNRSYPRSAIGVDKEKQLYMVVADGGSRKSRGVTLSDFAKLMASLGVHNAINLDGGSSSQLYAGGGIVNNPSRGNKPVSMLLGAYAHS